MITTVILTRHGHVEGINPRRFRGRQDIPLSTLGEIQANTTAKRISSAWRPSAVFTSPMSRCIQTGATIAKVCHVSNAVLDPLNELDYGAWQWKTHDEIRRLHPQSYATWHETPHLFCFPGGESLQDLVARTGDALRFVLEKCRGETLVLIGLSASNFLISPFPHIGEFLSILAG